MQTRPASIRWPRHRTPQPALTGATVLPCHRQNRPPPPADPGHRRTALWRAGAWHRPGGLARLWAIILLGGAVPLALLVAAGVSLYNQAINEADLRVERSARIGEEQALKVFQTNIALLHRVLDALGDDADEPLLAREAPLHRQLRRMSSDVMQLQGIFVIGASGRMLATDRVLPAPHGIDFSDRPFLCTTVKAVRSRSSARCSPQCRARAS